MDLNNCFTIDKYQNAATGQFTTMQSRLNDIGKSFNERMEGKTYGAMVGSVIGTAFWLVGYIIFALVFSHYVSIGWIIFSSIVFALLITFMVIDEITDFSYYGKLANYKSNIIQLQNRINVGRNSISSNQELFLRQRQSGWNYQLSPAPSIPDEAESVMAAVSNMVTLKKGFIHGAKNAMFYTSIVAIAIVGSVGMFPAGSGIMCGFSGNDLDAGLLIGLNITIMIIAIVAAIIVGKMIWSSTNCRVRNKTLFALIIGPIAYIGLVFLGTLFIMLVVWLFKIIFALIVLAIVIAIAFCSCSGG